MDSFCCRKSQSHSGILLLPFAPTYLHLMPSSFVLFIDFSRSSLLFTIWVFLCESYLYVGSAFWTFPLSRFILLFSLSIDLGFGPFFFLCSYLTPALFLLSCKGTSHSLVFSFSPHNFVFVSWSLFVSMLLKCLPFDSCPCLRPCLHLLYWLLLCDCFLTFLAFDLLFWSCLCIV